MDQKDERHERIRQRAYAIWEREGRPEGVKDRHWHQAAEEIAAEEKQGAGGNVETGPGPAKPRKPRARKA